MKRWTVLAVLPLVMGCALRHSEPFAGPLALNPKQARGQRVYMVQCQQCHPGGEGGLGPSLSDKPAPPFAIKAQVRAGAGAMPAFSEEKISGDDVDALVDYMLARRHHRR
jgi:mono/diheme cytochrome c family protein